jgi:hypothetical protein
MFLVIILTLSLALVVERRKGEQSEQLALRNENAVARARQARAEVQEAQAQIRKARDEAKRSIPGTSSESLGRTSLEADP